MTLELRQGASAVHFQSAPTPVAIGNVSVGVGFSIALPTTLQGIAGTARFLIADGRAIAASLKEVGSVSLEGGRGAWTWRFPKDVKIFNPVRLSHGGRVFVVGWRNRATHAGEVFVAAIDVASGRGIWQRLFDDGFPTGTAMDPVLCKMRLTAGEEFTIDYESPKKDVPSRRVVLDSGTGETINDTKL